MDTKDLVLTLKTTIQREVLVFAKDGALTIDPQGEPMDWMFDFRSILLRADVLEMYAELFWEECGNRYPFQVAGLETVALPLLAAIVLKGKERGTPVNAFYMRKSRKPYGLQKIIEGKITDEPIILVDDIMHSGGSFIKQIEYLKKENKKPSCIFAVVRFHELSHYTFAHNQGIDVVAPIPLSEFGLSVSAPQPKTDYDAFSTTWVKRYSKTPNYFYRIPKSAPVIDEKNIYFGSDDGVMRSLTQTDGSIVWEYKILGRGAAGKTIFSSPTLFNNTIYFGAYDGNFYALDAETGKKKWIYFDADWIGSSPCVAEDLNTVYVGLEFGLFRKRGGIVALDATTGEKKWEYISMPEYTHASPTYSKKYNAVAIGSNDGFMYLFRATDGELLWKVPTGGEIKAAPTFDEKRGLLVFGSFDGNIYVMNVENGATVFSIPTKINIYSTPLVSGDRAYATGLDKNIYCINLDTRAVEWKFECGSRLFASPELINGHIYVGSNDGRLYEFDADTGKNTAFFQTSERITNRIAYNKDTKRFFVLTYAGDLYCLERK